jgi:hypothetical protein
MAVDYDAGVAMTERIMDAVAPIVDGQPTALVIEAFAAAMMATLSASTDKRQARLVLHYYAERILDYAAEID